MLERIQDRADDRSLAVHAIRAEAQAIVGRHVATVFHLPGEIELVLERGLDTQALLAGPIDHIDEERPRAQLPGATVEGMHIAQHACFTRRIRQKGEGARIGDQADLADRAEMRARGQMLGQGECLHGDRQPDTRLEAIGQG